MEGNRQLREDQQADPTDSLSRAEMALEIERSESTLKTTEVMLAQSIEDIEILQEQVTVLSVQLLDKEEENQQLIEKNQQLVEKNQQLVEEKRQLMETVREMTILFLSEPSPLQSTEQPPPGQPEEQDEITLQVSLEPPAHQFTSAELMDALKELKQEDRRTLGTGPQVMRQLSATGRREREQGRTTIRWISDHVVHLTTPTHQQCQIVIGQLSSKHHSVRLISSSPDVTSTLLSSILDKKKKVKHLSISDSPLTQECAELLSQLLTHHKSLQALSLGNCCVTDEILAVISSSLSHNTTLTGLLLPNNPEITSLSAHTLVKLLHDNNSLTDLDLRGTSLAEDAVLLLMDSLRTNKTLWTLYLDPQHKNTCLKVSFYADIVDKLSFDFQST